MSLNRTNDATKLAGFALIGLAAINYQSILRFLLHNTGMALQKPKPKRKGRR
jgi:hypothetical protein